MGKDIKSEILSLMERVDTLSGNNTDLLNEDRKRFITLSQGQFIQIIENWALVHYCTLIGRIQTKKHWSDELRDSMCNCSDFKLKDDRYAKRYKTLLASWSDRGLNEPSNIEKIISHKFYNIEGFKRDTKILNAVVFDLISNSQKIIDLIAKKNKNEIYDYVYSTI